MKNQLFTSLDVDVPYAASFSDGDSRIHQQVILAFPFTFWPDGKPCDLVNMYFLDIAYSTTGRTLTAYASQLSHLIRYCYDRNVPFFQLTDQDMDCFAHQLSLDTSARLHNERARNNNTIRSIISRVIAFLNWCQENLISPLCTPLIGPRESSPRICIIRKKRCVPHLQRAVYVWEHRSMPERESRDPKRAIAEPIIEEIQRAIDQLSWLDAKNEQTLRRFRSNIPLYSAQLEYLRCRRHFMIWLMRRTGLRPAEMLEMGMSAHVNIMKDKILNIPTKKRRRRHTPFRRFPITLRDSATFLRYANARDNFLHTLRENGIRIPESDCIFLGINGIPVKKGSLEREFARLAKFAGFDSCEACLSMFRHRFITLEVIVHLKEFMIGSGKSRQMMTDIDYESILKRVAAKTGHGSPRSLLHYIDVAWKQMDVWGNVDRALDRLRAAERLFDEILALKLDVRRIASSTTSEIIEFVANRLQDTIGTARTDLEKNSFECDT